MYHVVRPMVTKIERSTCDFHKRHPGHPFPGCTCVTSYSSREKSFEEMTQEEMDIYFAALIGEHPDGRPLF